MTFIGENLGNNYQKVNFTVNNGSERVIIASSANNCLKAQISRRSQE
jgi:hypothetical protein